MGQASRRRAKARRLREMEAAKAAAAPPPPPPNRWQRFRKRIKGVPGASLLLGLLQLIWRYWPTAFRRGEDADFLLDLWTRAGGDIPLLIQTITSPFFGFALILGGIGYAAFAKEPEKRVPAIIPRIAWSVIVICALLLGTAFLFEQFLRASHIGQYVSDLTSERHVTESQRKQLKDILGPVANKFPRLIEVSAADNPEARGYARELMAALTLAGLKVASLNPRIAQPTEMHAFDTKVKGVFMQIPNSKNPSEEVMILWNALNKVGIRTVFYKNLDYWNDNYNITVGLK